jgi:hypothetical protein
LKDGIEDDTYKGLFSSILQKVMDVYKPEVVMQDGTEQTLVGIIINPIFQRNI